MEKIHLNNYEAWFLDYLEGRLHAEEVAELMLFLEKHPELKALLEEVEPIAIDLPATSTPFAGKEKLKKPVITLENYPAFFVDAGDGTLDADTQLAVTYFLKAHPELELEYKACTTIRLVPDTRIVFEGKQKLYKKTAVSNPEQVQETAEGERKGRIFWLPAYNYLAVAASFALLLGVWFLNAPSTRLSPAPSFGIAGVVIPPVPVSPSNEAPRQHPAALAPSVNNQLAVFHPNAGKQMVQAVSAPVVMAYMDRESFSQTLPVFFQAEEELPMNAVAVQSEPAPLSAEAPNQELLSLKDFAAKKLLEQFGADGLSSPGKKHTGWEMAKVAARGFNRVSGRKIKIKERYDADGELVSYALNGGGLEYAHAIKK